MAWVAVTCPQCGAPLPRVALWRSVKCGSCNSLINKTEDLVKRDSFRQALIRARREFAGLDSVVCGGAVFQLLQHLGTGNVSEVYLARRLDPLPLLATVKLSSASKAASLYTREADVARELQRLDADGAGAYFSKLLPEVMSQGAVEGSPGKQCLVLRHPTGFWGSLATLNDRLASGLDPRHAVWIWRRMLEVLNFVHRQGWCHGDIRPEHALVHPADHGVRLIGWSEARKDAGEAARGADFCRSARVVQVLLCGAGGSGALPAQVPEGLARLINQAATDEVFCRAQGAEGLDSLLRAEAKAAFGPPTFVPLHI